MNQNLDISSLIKSHEGIIKNGRSEANSPEDSLERMMFKAHRQGRKNDFEAIEEFLNEMKKEILTFRKMAQIGRNVQENGVFAWATSFLPAKAKHPFVPHKINKLVEKKLSPETPFLCFEGVSTQQEGERSGLMAGPYFGVLASNTSESKDLPQDTTLVFTFSRAATPKGAIGLRIWKLETFSELYKGDNAETSKIGLLPDKNDQVSKEDGDIQRLFLSAADKMGRAALSKNPPQHVEDSWLKILREYEGIQTNDVSPS